MQLQTAQLQFTPPQAISFTPPVCDFIPPLLFVKHLAEKKLALVENLSNIRILLFCFGQDFVPPFGRKFGKDFFCSRSQLRPIDNQITQRHYCCGVLLLFRFVVPQRLNKNLMQDECRHFRNIQVNSIERYGLSREIQQNYFLPSVPRLLLISARSSFTFFILTLSSRLLASCSSKRAASGEPSWQR